MLCVSLFCKVASAVDMNTITLSPAMRERIARGAADESVVRQQTATLFEMLSQGFMRFGRGQHARYAAVLALIAQAPEGIDIDARNAAGDPLLHRIVIHAYSSEMIEAFTAHHPTMDAPNAKGETALLLAAKTGMTARVESLLKAGANASLFHSRWGTPLGAALHRNHFDVALELFDHGVDFTQSCAIPTALSDGRWQHRYQQEQARLHPRLMLEAFIADTETEQHSAAAMGRDLDVNTLHRLHDARTLKERLTHAEQQWQAFERAPDDFPLTAAALTAFAALGHLEEAFMSRHWLGKEVLALDLYEQLPRHCQQRCAHLIHRFYESAAPDSVVMSFDLSHEKPDPQQGTTR